MSMQIESIVQRMLESYLVNDTFELVDVEYVKEAGQWYLRVFVDKEGGIEIDDCGKISEHLSEQLDLNDPIAEPYFLEVSSPGAERPLRNAKDFCRALNKHVYLKTNDTFDGLNEFEGELIAYDELIAEVRIGKKNYSLPVNKITQARLAVIF